MKFLYKYPQGEFPYTRLVEEAANRGKLDPEFEIWHSGVFDEGRYFDVFVEYAKESVEELRIRITAHNRGPEDAPLNLLPTVWFRNRWSWQKGSPRPSLWAGVDLEDGVSIEIDDDYYARRCLLLEGRPQLLFTENETNRQALYNSPNRSPFVKDSFHDYLIRGDHSAVNPRRIGTKAAGLYSQTIAAGSHVTIELSLTDQTAERFPETFATTFDVRKREADEFYAKRIPAKGLSEDAVNVQRQAFGGLFWTKQYFHYDVEAWLEGDPSQPKPPAERLAGRNSDWRHLFNADVISMPDKWEYPWYAAWDLAFHCIPIAVADPEFAKEQILLFLREWYMHPSGQIPAYEWDLGDVNPPVHAWAVWRVYKIDKRVTGRADRAFLERAFHKLLLNFTWWVNRKDPEAATCFRAAFWDSITSACSTAPTPLKA